MPFPGQQLHQPVFTVTGIQPERHPYQQTAGHNSERNAYPLIHACQIEDDHRKEHRRQPAREDEQVLRLEPLELDGIARAFVYRILHAFRGRRNAGWWRPRSGRYTRRTSWRRSSEVSGVTAGELAVGLDAAHQSQHGADGVAQLGSGVEIRGHEAGCLVDTGKALALRESVGGNHRAHHGKKDSSLHCRIVWVRHKFEFDGEDKWG